MYDPTHRDTYADDWIPAPGELDLPTPLFLNRQRKDRPFGYGDGFCYIVGTRLLAVCADSLGTARLCCAPTLKLWRVFPYRPNPGRKVFCFVR